MSLASGRSMDARVFSLTTMLPFSVWSLNTIPFPWRREAICFLLPRLKTVTLSLSFFPVFSETRSSTKGGKTSWTSLSRAFIRSIRSVNNSLALSMSNLKPFLSCSDVITATSCSSCMLSSEKPSLLRAVVRYSSNLTVSDTSRLQ